MSISSVVPEQWNETDADRFDFEPYLEATAIIDWQRHFVRHLARKLALDAYSTLAVAKRCYDFVRDDIKHASDHDIKPVACRASEVLILRAGLCYSKSHLLAALLRANGIPAGFCYQRLRLAPDQDRYALHGFNACYLPRYGWYRLDARGNKEGIDARFDPPTERLAYRPERPGEMTDSRIWVEPLDLVVKILRSHASHDELCRALPDVDLAEVEN